MNTETTYTQEQLETILSTGLSKVIFYKVDGSLRELVCTRDMSIIPEDMHPTSTKNRVKSATTVTVYDTEDDSWKSFLVENLVFIDRE